MIKCKMNDAEVEESLLADFDINLVSIENILKPFIKQVRVCWFTRPNQYRVSLVFVLLEETCKHASF